MRTIGESRSADAAQTGIAFVLLNRTGFHVDIDFIHVNSGQDSFQGRIAILVLPRIYEIIIIDLLPVLPDAGKGNLKCRMRSEKIFNAHNFSKTTKTCALTCLFLSFVIRSIYPDQMEGRQ